MYATRTELVALHEFEASCTVMESAGWAVRQVLELRTGLTPRDSMTSRTIAVVFERDPE